jgi:hypothetical protein
VSESSSKPLFDPYLEEVNISSIRGRAITHLIMSLLALCVLVGLKFWAIDQLGYPMNRALTLVVVLVAFYFVVIAGAALKELLQTIPTIKK